MTYPGEIFASPSPRVYSIDAGRPFLADLADGLLGALGEDPVAIAQTRIYLPTRRAAREAARAFAAAFARRGRGAALTPRCLAFGDIEEDEALGGDIEAEMSLAPAISTLERRFVFTQMIAAADRAHFDGQSNWAAAYAAAGELAALDALGDRARDSLGIAQGVAELGDAGEQSWRAEMFADRTARHRATIMDATIGVRAVSARPPLDAGDVVRCANQQHGDDEARHLRDLAAWAIQLAAFAEAAAQAGKNRARPHKPKPRPGKQPGKALVDEDGGDRRVHVSRPV